MCLSLISCGEERDSDKDADRNKDTEYEAINGIESPDETIRTFMRSLSKQDAENMLACMYTKPFLEYADFADYIDFQSAYLFSSMDLGPTDYEYYQTISEYRMNGAFARSLQALTFSILFFRWW